MMCSSGHENIAGAAFCASCGLAVGTASTAPPLQWPAVPTATPGWPPAQPSRADWSAPQQPSPFGGPQYGSSLPPQNGLGTAALVLGILGMLLGCIFSALAIIFGAIGISRANSGRATNKGAATAGLILGIVGLALWLLFYAAISGS